jgi:uncharacterized protein YecE (DUF72 family)
MGNLEEFLSELSSTPFRYAIEFRDESWLTASVMSLLEDYKIAYVIVDEPKLPIDIRVTTDFAYVRWHGHGSRPWYNYRYSENELEEWKPRLKELTDKADVVLGYFNNHFSGNAPINALQMLKFMEMITPQQTLKLDRMLDQTAIKQASLDEF